MDCPNPVTAVAGWPNPAGGRAAGPVVAPNPVPMPLPPPKIPPPPKGVPPVLVFVVDDDDAPKTGPLLVPKGRIPPLTVAPPKVGTDEDGCPKELVVIVAGTPPPADVT